MAVRLPLMAIVAVSLPPSRFIAETLMKLVPSTVPEPAPVRVRVLALLLRLRVLVPGLLPEKETV